MKRIGRWPNVQYFGWFGMYSQTTFSRTWERYPWQVIQSSTVGRHFSCRIVHNASSTTRSGRPLYTRLFVQAGRPYVVISFRRSWYC